MPPLSILPAHADDSKDRLYESNEVISITAADGELAIGKCQALANSTRRPGTFRRCHMNGIARRAGITVCMVHRTSKQLIVALD